MNKSQIDHNRANATMHRKVQHSSTLNRKYVHRPSTTAQTTSAKSGDVKVQIRKTAAPRAAKPQTAAKVQPRIITKKPVTVQPAAVRPQVKEQVRAQVRQQINRQQAAKQRVAKQQSAQALKDQAIEKALRSVATMESQDKKAAAATPAATPAKVKKSHRGRRFAMAFACAVVCVAALGAFISMNMPDLSVRVTAMQTGIEATYPSYVPRDYSLSNITSEEGKISMEFSGPENNTFTLSEEKSSWDSTALLNNYVKDEWEDEYTITHEQGITVYISGSNATWVNGGLLYTITASNGTLTKKQINNIVVSL